MGVAAKGEIVNRVIFPVTAMLAALMISCGQHQSAPSPSVPAPDVGKERSSGKTSSNPNIAVLEWEAVDDRRVRGYRIYYGPYKGEYLQLRGEGINAGDVTTYTVRGLGSGRRYYFAVTAYDSSYNESGYSNEVFKDIP